MVTQHDRAGYPYRTFEHEGRTLRINAQSSKQTLYYDHGIVNVGMGSGYKYTLPDGRTLEGYTDDPAIVRQYVEMWNDVNPDLPISTDRTKSFNPYDVGATP